MCITRPPTIVDQSPRRGAAAVEFAMVLPVLLVLALGCVDLGRALGLYIAVSNSARVGAEYGAAHRFTAYTRPFWETQVRQQSTTELQSANGFDGSKMLLTLATTSMSDGTIQVSVTVAYPFQMMTTWPGLPDQFNLQRQVTYRQFR
jgi:Flp pilus assembly protein TadG